MAILKEHKFDYCTVQHRDDNIVVVEINDGIEVDADMAAELVRAADKKITGPFGILSNRIHSYSLSFAAMTALARYNNMAALAIVVYNHKSRILVETQNYFISVLSRKPIKIFWDTETALNWLQDTLQNLPSNNQSSDSQEKVIPSKLTSQR